MTHELGNQMLDGHASPIARTGRAESLGGKSAEVAAPARSCAERGEMGKRFEGFADEISARLDSFVPGNWTTDYLWMMRKMATAIEEIGLVAHEPQDIEPRIEAVLKAWGYTPKTERDAALRAMPLGRIFPTPAPQLDPTPADARATFATIASTPMPDTMQIKHMLEWLDSRAKLQPTRAHGYQTAASMIDRLGVECVRLEQELKDAKDAAPKPSDDWHSLYVRAIGYRDAPNQHPGIKRVLADLMSTMADTFDKLKEANAIIDQAKPVLEWAGIAWAELENAAAVFRRYESDHRAKIKPLPHMGDASTALVNNRALIKAERNGALAARIESVLKDRPSEALTPFEAPTITEIDAATYGKMTGRTYTEAQRLAAAVMLSEMADIHANQDRCAKFVDWVAMKLGMVRA